MHRIATITSVFTIGPIGPWPPLTCEKSRIGQKCNVRKVASIILQVSMLYPQENNTINECSKHRGEEGWTEVKMESRPSSVLDALEVSRNQGTFPHISTLLQIFATLPVTTSVNDLSVH